MYRIGCARSQLVTLREFKDMPTDAFYDFDADRQFMNLLKPMSIKTLLDVDAHFLKSQLLTKGFNDLTEIDCISEKNLPPIKENIYSRVYKKLSDCQFRHYDAALVYGRTNIHFMTAFSELENMTDVVITFVRYNSNFEKHITANAGYKIIHAGRAISQDLGYLGDNTGDNISYLNPHLNELTALYWMWKNTNHSIIGLAHYRKFLT